MSRIEDQSGKEDWLLALVYLQYDPSATIASEKGIPAYHKPTHL